GPRVLGGAPAIGLRGRRQLRRRLRHDSAKRPPRLRRGRRPRRGVCVRARRGGRVAERGRDRRRARGRAAADPRASRRGAAEVPSAREPAGVRGADRASMKAPAYVLLGLTAIVAALASVLTFALLRFLTAARDVRRGRTGPEPDPLSTALHEALD